MQEVVGQAEGSANRLLDGYASFKELIEVLPVLSIRICWRVLVAVGTENFHMMAVDPRVL